ncbi:MAG: mechanosensitive ion channel family protein [Candidatus Aenigmarchaeota archaeon]|nr:mechanosensitive ion channel family protein [Candidatus Aenigmarchaeota archaeon]
MMLEFLKDAIANETLRAFVIFFSSFLLLKITALILKFLFKKVAERTKTEVDDIIIKRWSLPINILIFVASVSLAIKEITFTKISQETINQIIFTAYSLSLAYIVYVFIDVTFIRIGKKISQKTDTTVDDTLLNIANTSFKVGFIVIAILYTLKMWGVKISPILASLGIAGIAVALALQQTLSNVFAGIALIMDKSIRVGDIVKLDTGEMGEIHSISLRSVRIKTFDNEMIIIPNSVIANAKIQNLLQPDPTVRVNIDFSVEYGTDPEYVKKIVLEEISDMQIIDKTKETRILFLSMGESGLNFRLMFWVDHVDKRWPAHQEAITKIYRRLYKEGIGIPFPQRTVWLREDENRTTNPFDEKFASTRDKIYPWFGYESEQKKLEEEVKKNKPNLKKIIKRIKKSKIMKRLRKK